MDSVGIRELKAHLSRHLRRVRAGARLLITERGHSIATISPIENAAEVGWADQMVTQGRASWTGGKPVGARKPVTLKGRRSASKTVLEDRG